MNIRHRHIDPTDLLLGQIAAAISLTANAPITRLKLVLQTQDENIRAGRLEHRYKGIVHCVKEIVRTEGVYHFWRGNLAKILDYVPGHVANFYLRDIFKKMNPYTIRDGTFIFLTANVLVGACAGGTAALISVPFDYARVRLAADVLKTNESQRQFAGLVDVWKRTIQKDGFFSMYRGLVSTVAGIIVYRGSYFGLYDTFVHIIKSDDLTTKFAIGYCTTLTAGSLAYPFDTIRKRMMMTCLEENRYATSLHCAKHILVHDGIRGFFHGFFVQTFASVTGAILLTGYDALRKKMEATVNKA